VSAEQPRGAAASPAEGRARESAAGASVGEEVGGARRTALVGQLLGLGHSRMPVPSPQGGRGAAFADRERAGLRGSRGRPQSRQSDRRHGCGMPWRAFGVLGAPLENERTVAFNLFVIILGAIVLRRS
jgi:hypothetical protein